MKNKLNKGNNVNNNGYGKVGGSNNINNREDLKKDVAKRLSSKPKQTFLRDFVYGGIDGCVTSFAIVTGVMGAKLSVVIILVLGLAKLFADGFSMAGANYLGTRTEVDEYNYFKAKEEKEIDEIPDEEIEEIRHIFKLKGFSGKELKKMVRYVVNHRRLWVDTMLAEEYGLCAVIRSPWMAAVTAFFAFLICGFIPLLPYMFNLADPLSHSFIFASITFFLIGSLKSKWAVNSWLRTGFETLIVGVAAASIAYLIAYACESFLIS